MSALIGREEEFRTIEDYVRKWIDESEAMCLFVNGVPGTGKTATVDVVLKKLLPEISGEVAKTKGKPTKRKLDKSVRLTKLFKNKHFLVQTRLCELPWIDKAN